MLQVGVARERYLSSAASSSRRPARRYLARVSTMFSTDQRIAPRHVVHVRRADRPSGPPAAPPCRATVEGRAAAARGTSPRPRPSGPASGRSPRRGGRCRASVAMSSRPPRPKTVLTFSRMKVSALFCSLAWATLCGQVPDVAHVVEEVGDAGAHQRGQHALVGGGRGHEHGLVDAVVEAGRRRGSRARKGRPDWRWGRWRMRPATTELRETPIQRA